VGLGSFLQRIRLKLHLVFPSKEMEKPLRPSPGRKRLQEDSFELKLSSIEHIWMGLAVIRNARRDLVQSYCLGERWGSAVGYQLAGTNVPNLAGPVSAEGPAEWPTPTSLQRSCPWAELSQANAVGVVLAQLQVKEKTNELTGLPPEKWTRERLWSTIWRDR
jgi:hypothetical protein